MRESTAIGSDLEEIVAALIVEADGSVSWVDLLSTETHLPEPAEVFLDWRFRPGMRDDRPVRTRVVVRLTTPIEP